MMILLGMLAALLLDSIVLMLCWIVAAMIGAYRVAIPICAVLAFALFAGWSSHPLTWLTALLFLTTGAIQGAIGLALWRRIPERFKQAFIPK